MIQVTHQQKRKNEHEMCGYSLFTDCSFDKKKIINWIITEVKIL